MQRYYLKALVGLEPAPQWVIEATELSTRHGFPIQLKSSEEQTDFPSPRVRIC
jgi:hypothetical protein